MALQNNDWLRLNHALGASLLDHAGRLAGTIQDMILEAGEGTARYAVVEAGPRLWRGKHLLPVDHLHVRISADEAHWEYSTDLTSDEIRRLPKAHDLPGSWRASEIRNLWTLEGDCIFNHEDLVRRLRR